MKKLLLMVYLVGIAAFYGYSQSLSLADSSGSVANNSTIVRHGLPTDDIIGSYIFVTNNSSASLDVKLKKVEIDIVPGSQNQFCWGLCFSPTVYESPDPITILAGATNLTDFVGEYVPNGMPGASTIRYVFFDSHNPTDSVCFNAEYSAFPLGIGDEVKANDVVVAFPNPASNILNLTYNVKSAGGAVLVIRNILGTTIREIPLSQPNGTERVMVNDLSEGIYFYSLMINGQNFSTRKLMIKH